MSVRLGSTMELSQAAMSVEHIDPGVAAQASFGPSWVKNRSWPKFPNLTTRTIRAIDLFSGVGGMTLGAMEAARHHGVGFDIALSVEQDSRIAGVYATNFGERTERHLVEDVSKVALTELHSTKGSIDLLLAGPPCQGHSSLNNKTRRADDRNLLFYEVAKFASEIEPKVVVIENVDGVQHDKSGAFARTVERLKELGYFVALSDLKASNFGVAQSRKRHFLVATNKPFTFSGLQACKCVESTTVREAIGDLTVVEGSIFDTPSRMTAVNVERAKHLRDNSLFELPNDLRPKCHRDVTHSYVSMYGRLRWDSPAQTITSGFGSMGQGRFLHPDGERMLTPHEVARLQSLPDFIDMSGLRLRTVLQTALGNLVPPPLIGAIINELFVTGHL